MYYENLDIFESKVNVHSDAYKENYKKMSSLVDKLNAKLSETLFQGDEKYLARSRSSGKFLGRER
jgi:hypothetical protein